MFTASPPTTYLTSIVFQSFNGQNYGYVTIQGSSSPAGVYRCLVGPTGQLSGCTLVPTTPSLGGSVYTAFNATNGQLYAYISNGQPGDPVAICTPSADGSSFGSCATSGTGSLSNGGVGITFQSFGGTLYAYVSNGDQTGGGTPSINQYTIGTNGQLTLFNTPFLYPNSLNLSFVNVGGTEFAYSVQSVTPSVDQCTLGGTNGSELQTCTVVNPSPPFPILSPGWVVTTTINGTSYAYVANVSANHVVLCTLSASTGFSTCEDSGGSGFNAPITITLQ